MKFDEYMKRYDYLHEEKEKVLKRVLDLIEMRKYDEAEELKKTELEYCYGKMHALDDYYFSQYD